MFSLLALLRRCLCHRRRRQTPQMSVYRHGESAVTSLVSSAQPPVTNGSSAAAVHPKPERPIRVASFNAALFSMAPAVPTSTLLDSEDGEFTNLTLLGRSKSTIDRPKSILKHSPLHPLNAVDADHNNNILSSRKQRFAKSKLRVSINLPDNEISRQLSFREGESTSAGKNSPLRSALSFSLNKSSGESFRSTRTVLEVLRELDADVLALQDVKADEADEMRPLSDLAAALGMNYAFAESWAPEYGNAILSKWPIKNWKVQKIADDTDFRNVLKSTIDVPDAGEVEFHCTHLDHLDENWRMKQISAIIQSSNGPHILAGGLNSLDETDYSSERWTDIVKYYEEMGKPVPKVEVMRFLKSKCYTDAKDFAGECESVVVIAKGQSVQGTCKYGTRVDYILATPNSTYKFVPGSYSVISSKGTSDHHIVKVDVVKATNNNTNTNVVGGDQSVNMKREKLQRLVKITANTSMNKGLWRTPIINIK